MRIFCSAGIFNYIRVTKSHFMKTKTLLLGSLVGGIAFFFLGWLLYGILLEPIMSANCNTSLNRPMEEMVWWALIASNVLWGLMVTLVLHWSQAKGFVASAMSAAYVGAILALAFDLSTYSMTTVYSNLTVILADVFTNTIMFALVGGILSFFNRK